MADTIRAAVTPHSDKLTYAGGHAATQIQGAPQATRAIHDFDKQLAIRFGKAGAITERAITWGDLANAGVVNLRLGGRLVGRLPGSEPPFAEPAPTKPRPETPHQPTGLTGYGAQTTVILTWAATTYAGHGTTEIYKAATSAFSAAVLAGRSNSRVYADRVGAAASFYYWARHVNELGEPGPFTQVGLQVTSGTLDETESRIAYDLLVVDKGIIVEALIGDAEIGGAKIRDASIDSAKIISLAADKITAGSMAVHQYLQSANYVQGSQGWRINADGTAEFYQISVRATLEAGSTITSPVINGGEINATRINGGELHATSIYGANVTASNLFSSILVSGDAQKWLAFDGYLGYILYTPNAKITQAGATEFSNVIHSGTWSTGLSLAADQWVKVNPGTGEPWVGA